MRELQQAEVDAILGHAQTAEDTPYYVSIDLAPNTGLDWMNATIKRIDDNAHTQIVLITAKQGALAFDKAEVRRYLVMAGAPRSCRLITRVEEWENPDRIDEHE